TSALKDKNGNLWFGHWGGGVSFYNKKLEKLKDLKLERFSNFKSITSMILDKNNDIWFGTNGAGVFKYEFESNNVVSFSKEDGFQSSVVKTMCLDGKGNIWFGTNKGIAIYRISKQLEEKGAFLLITQNDGLSANQITDIQRLGNNSMAVGTEYNGLTIIGNTKDLSQLTFRIINKQSGLLSNDVLCIYAENEENLWMGTRNEGVIRFNLKTGDFRQLSTKQGLNYFKINVIFSDREQNIWIGTDLGLNLFRGEGFLIYDERDGLLNNVIWDISEDKEHRLYLATNQGLSRIKFIKNEKSDYTERLDVVNFDQKNGMSSEIALSVLIDDDGDIWCGTGFGGLNYIRAGSERVTRVLDSSRGLSSNTIYSITQDKQGYVWVGTNTGASRIDKASFEVKNFSPADGLGGDNIYKVFCDSKGMIWFASIGGFLTKYQDGTFIRFDSSYQVTQKFITSVTEDPQGNIWFGAYGGGVYKYNGKSFDNFTQEDGLSSNSPYSLIADDLGNLWIGTSQGIDKLNIAERSVKNYRKSEGFMGIEPNPNSVWKDHNGNIWFGTIMGAVKFDLSKDRLNQYQPVTVVERLQINRELFNFPEDNVFAYNENHLTFEYIGISLTNPEHVQYKYMLEGFDKDWSPVTSSNDVVYSNLPPGTYKFKVLASNNDGIWNELPTTYAFRIRPPFWQTWWFYTLSFILIVGIIYLIFQLRVKNLVAAKEKLEHMVEERTQEIIAKNIELERKNKDILDSINYARRIQTALLPSQKKVRENLSNSFIFFKPKDIVSGDFYWMERIGNKVLFAAADCTGHGVPGAFMSFIGHNGLNKAVIENDILTPSKILDLLNREVNETLKQEEEREVKDGMDIAMCSLDIETLELEFAGAFNPLYLVRDGEVQEFKGDRRPIGSFPNDKERLFANHKMKLKKGDALYIFSDGFPDQFGGPDGKKFRYKQFREILVECQQKDMNTMDEYLENVMSDWMGEFEQIDDVVIIGVKIA
ncbi:MAG: two-component regulator propeller domain-containing protein, partial [Vicingaceae bacterium]